MMIQSPEEVVRMVRDYDEYVARKVASIGMRFYHDLVLLDNSVRRLEGIVKRIPYNGRSRITLVYKGLLLSKECEDANWDNGRRHYPWRSVESV